MINEENNQGHGFKNVESNWLICYHKWINIEPQKNLM